MVVVSQRGVLHKVEVRLQDDSKPLDPQKVAIALSGG